MENFFSEGSLVMLRLPTDYGYSNTWWRVMFVDTDDTFIGRLEKYHWLEYTAHKKGDDVRWDSDLVQHVFKEKEQFCYGDNITICTCVGLCRDK
jgi:hypothetical protein